MMKAGDIWRFPISDESGNALLRVLLRVRDLDLPVGNPMAFVEDGFLVQVSRSDGLGKETFDCDNLLIDGTFLVQDGRWDRHGYQRIGKRPAEIEDVEFPFWFTNVSAGSGRLKTVFCRGEFQHDCDSLDRHILKEREWECSLTRRYPAQLSACLAAGPSLTSQLGRSDIRYHAARDEILEHVAARTSRPFAKLVADDPAMFARYAAALSKVRKGK